MVEKQVGVPMHLKFSVNVLKIAAAPEAESIPKRDATIQSTPDISKLKFLSNY